ncbi:hypothetical protein MRBLMR1_001090 [Neorhizobium sp. LMR1-1-1.1]
MPEQKSRLSQLIINEQKSRGLTERECAVELGVLQQTYSTWKAGRIPREKVWPALSKFLNVPEDTLKELIDEATGSPGGKLPPLTVYSNVRTYGRMADRKEAKLKFDTSRKNVPEGRYAVIVDTKIMEPALPVGCKAWLDPGIWPKPGHDVVAHARGNGWIGRLAKLENGNATLHRFGADPIEIPDVDAVHVIVLSERI